MRLIDADALLKKLPREELVSRMIVAGMPAIEAELVRCGHWEVWYHGEGGFIFNCSECGKLLGWRTNFCPNCGAKMEE